jgi:hypothetical protein
MVIDGSSTSYTGQIARHALIGLIKAKIGGLNDRVTGGNELQFAGDVLAELKLLYTCVDDTDPANLDEAACDGEAVGVATMPGAAQMTIGDISGGKNLKGKMAGNDAKGQHKNFTGADSDRNNDGNAQPGDNEFVGWTAADGSALSPEALLYVWFQMMDDAAQRKVSGAGDTYGGEALPVHVSTQGHDLQQLAQKFLLGAVAFSQGADDYLDDDIAGKGILSGNVEPYKAGKAYTSLEHQWDEGFGYFGAARDYLEYTDDEIAGKAAEGRKGYHDTDGNMSIDLAKEYNWGHSINAAKRDRGMDANGNPRRDDLTNDAYMGFYMGRKLINDAAGDLTPEQLEELKGYRNKAVGAWEKAIAATVIHYINDVLADMAAADYSFLGHAKHWGELKGFALSFQFNPRSKLSDAKFAEFHGKVGTKPALPGDANFEQYKTDLADARTILKEAYEFADDDVANW